jgi:hypothetical protein
MIGMCVAEAILWIALIFLFWKKKLYVRFPAMTAYLGLHVLTSPLLLTAMLFEGRPGYALFHSLYFYTQWGVYFSSAVLLYFICLEIFCAALSGFPGLMHFGVVIFRWVSVTAVLICLTSAPIVHITLRNLNWVCFSLARTISILELCLLAFLCLNLSGLRLSMRDYAFGLALGLGLLSANDFVVSVMVTYYGAPSELLSHIHEAVTLVSLAVWLVYFFLPEPARKPVVLPVNSALYRWNEIASALGHTGTQVAVQQPANSFFLSDVEKVVETVLQRTLPPTEADAENKSGH